ncbi:MAG: hypothetical protein ABH816_02150 [Candidatus Levyibacteriota bacterium]
MAGSNLEALRHTEQAKSNKEKRLKVIAPKQHWFKVILIHEEVKGVAMSAKFKELRHGEVASCYNEWLQKRLGIKPEEGKSDELVNLERKITRLTRCNPEDILNTAKGLLLKHHGSFIPRPVSPTHLNGKK